MPRSAGAETPWPMATPGDFGGVVADAEIGVGESCRRWRVAAELASGVAAVGGRRLRVVDACSGEIGVYVEEGGVGRGDVGGRPAP